MSDQRYLNGICGGSFDGAEIRRKYKKFNYWDEPDKSTPRRPIHHGQNKKYKAGRSKKED